MTWHENHKRGSVGSNSPNCASCGPLFRAKLAYVFTKYLRTDRKQQHLHIVTTKAAYRLDCSAAECPFDKFTILCPWLSGIHAIVQGYHRRPAFRPGPPLVSRSLLANTSCPGGSICSPGSKTLATTAGDSTYQFDEHPWSLSGQYARAMR